MAELEDKYDRFKRQFNIDIEAIEEAALGEGSLDPDLQQIASLTPTNDSVLQRKDGSWTYRSPTQLKADMGISAGENLITTLPLFNVEDYGAVGDGITDDYEAIKEAWDDMISSSNGGLLFFPRAVTYRINANITSRVQVTEDEARAIFPLPMIARTANKKVRGVLGVGNPYSVRPAELGGSPGQNQTCSILFVDYTEVYEWSETTGLPCIFGATDADMTDNEGNTFTNIHFTWDNLILRNSDNPSLCGINIEQVSTCEIGSIKIDVESVLDDAPEPTHPTGASILLPRSNNNVAILVDKIVVEGHYTGIPITEHIDLRSGIALRCKIGVANRRLNSHYGIMHMLKIEQCQFGFAGYDPSGEAPNLGVVAWQGWTGMITFVDVEDYAYNGETPWIYTPVYGSHIYDPLNRFNGSMHFQRINSEPQSSPGIGIGVSGGSDTVYVIGTSGTNSPIAIYNYAGNAATRVAGTAPENPVEDPPNAPTIGTATAGVLSASVAFTPSGSGPTADSFTATSTPGSITGTNSTSPITVTGLTAGQSYTFTVHATNDAGNSGESAASNSVVPTSSAGLPSDNFNRSNSGSLGTSSSDHVWLGDPQGTWEIVSNKAEAVTTGTAWNPAWLETEQTDFVVYADITHIAGERGICGRLVDADNFYYLDYQWESSNTANGQLYKKVGGSLTALGSGFVVSSLVAEQTVRLKIHFNGSTITAYVNKVLETDTQVVQVTDTDLAGTKAGIVSLVTTTPHVTFEDFVVADI